jgi:hypothetical protein
MKGELKMRSADVSFDGNQKIVMVSVVMKKHISSA